MAFWDGGPVEIAGTVDEGDDVSGFRVVHLPGHAPGLIALFRESDRLALTSDCFYVIDPETCAGTRPARRTRRSTRTPSRRASRCASSPRSIRRPPGRATRIR